MLKDQLGLLRCPITRSPLELKIISTAKKYFNEKEFEVVNEGILFNSNGWFYPVIKAIPRLIVEAFEDYESFLKLHMPDYALKRKYLEDNYPKVIKYIKKKNKHTKKSFSQEWSLFNYSQDRTWDLSPENMFHQFLIETDETVESINGKWIFDAGCGNGALDKSIAAAGASVLAMDFSLSIERAYENNSHVNAFFVQGDIQFPPVCFEAFDIVHSSGVLIATENTELSFSCIEPCVKEGGKLSVWLYHPRKSLIHNGFNFLRKFTSKLPVKFQYYLYLLTLFPISYVVKRLKGNKQNKREMMIDLLDGLTPEFRHEHTTEEAASWFSKRNYHSVKVTTESMWGFSIIGIKS